MLVQNNQFFDVNDKVSKSNNTYLSVLLLLLYIPYFALMIKKKNQKKKKTEQLKTIKSSNRSNDTKKLGECLHSFLHFTRD